MRRRRNVPAMIVAALGGALLSMLAGLLLASYATAGVMPPYLPTATRSHVAQVDRDAMAMTTVQQIAARVSDARPDGQDL